MTDDNRQIRISKIRHKIANGVSEHIACASVGVTVAWWERWRDADALTDAKRVGRPASCTVSEADAKTLREYFLRSNKGKSAGSMAGAARWCAYHELIAPELAACILKERADLCALPAPVKRVFRDITAQEFAKYRDPKKGMGKSDGIRTPGWLRMCEEGGARLEPGQRWVPDDASVNVGIVVPWSRGGDACSNAFGVRVARFQLLAFVDCATDAIVGYSFVMNSNDSYKAADVVSAIYHVGATTNEFPREMVMEGGSWQANKTKRFLELAGIRLISAKGDPGQKLIESVFNRLWTLLSLALPPQGQIGRFRGEMAKESLIWLACREGKKDPREYFPTFPVFIAALRQAMVAHNTKPIDSRVYGERWVPAIEYEKRKPETMMPVPAALRREALPAEKVVTLKLNGACSIRWDSPHGFPHDYVFATEDLYQYGGAKVRVQFDPMNIRDGAVISLAATHRGEKENTVIAEAARCISPAPTLDPIRDPYGYLDARSEARAQKKASRALVSTTVGTLDQRVKFTVPEPTLTQIEDTQGQRLEPTFHKFIEAEETDFAALEAAVGIY